MATDRTFRSLAALAGASTNRVFNLLRIGELHIDNADFHANPFFSSQVLNNAIVVKHRLRTDEMDLFSTARTIATKIIIPFEKSDLRSGGKSLMVGQRGFQDLVREVGNYGDGRNIDRDLKILSLIDRIPSLDPFLLREHLRCHEISPDSHYFEISEADQRRMFDFVSGELRRLTDMAGGKSQSSAGARMVEALLSSEVGEKLEPLRQTLQLNETEFREGVFSWRGFLYYKWNLLEFWPTLIKALKQLKVIQPVRPIDFEQSVYIASARTTIIRSAKHGSEHIRKILGVYDSAYDSLIAEGDARKFREFLLDAPSLFLEIGEKMGALSHLTSFWCYRFPDNTPNMIGAEELVAMFEDFCRSVVVPSTLAA